jgi:hypothetical protein
VKLALVAPAAILTDAGTVTALLLLVRLTVVALVAADVSVTVHASVPAPVSDPLLQETPLSVAGACPVPLRLIVAAAALLLIATDPVTAPAVVGSKLIVSVAACPAFSVIGKLLPGSENPVPVTDTPLMVTAAVPEEVTVTVLVVAVFSGSVPNATLVALSFIAGVPDALSCKANVFDTPPAVAVSVAVCAVLTAEAVAVNAALEAPAATVTEAGTVTALLLLARLTVTALAAATVRVTVQASVPAPVSVPLLQETALNAAAACPVPLSAIVAVLDALLLIVTVPLTAPVAVGSKPIVSVAVWFGFRVIGKLLPGSENPVPVTDTPLMVTAAVPEEVTVTVLVVAVFSGSVPNATLVALSFIAGVPDGFSCNVYVSDTLSDIAVRVTVCAAVTPDTFAVNAPLCSFADMYKSAGTFTAVLLLVSVTFRLLFVLRLIVTVQVSVPDPLNELVLQDNPVSCAAPKEASGKQPNIRPSNPARHSLSGEDAPRAQLADSELEENVSSAP